MHRNFVEWRAKTVVFEWLAHLQDGEFNYCGFVGVETSATYSTIACVES